MRSSWTEPVPHRRSARHGAVLIAALLGTAAGLLLPRVDLTAASLTSAGQVAGTYTVPMCSASWANHVATLSPLRHWSFAAAPAGDVPSPGLLTCDPSGALALHGGAEEGVTDGGTVGATAVGTLALRVAVTDLGVSGVLATLSQADGHRVDLRVGGGMLAVAETPAGGGPPVVLAQTPLGDSAVHLVGLTRAGSTVVLWLDGTAVGSSALLGGTATPLRLSAGAAAGSGQSAASAVVDEILLLPAALDGSGWANLRAADVW